MKIILTGTPGTGKSTLAKKLAKQLKCDLISINELVDTEGLVTGIEDGVKVVNLAKLKDVLIREIKVRKKIVIEGHLACEIKLPGALVIVLRANPEVVRKRLCIRAYDKKKLEKNVLCEMLDYCTILSIRNYKRVYEVDASGKAKSAMEQIDRILNNNGKKLKAGWVNWSEYLYQSLTS